jgi:hypothetical protein
MTVPWAHHAPAIRCSTTMDRAFLFTNGTSSWSGSRAPGQTHPGGRPGSLIRPLVRRPRNSAVMVEPVCGRDAPPAAPRHPHRDLRFVEGEPVVAQQPHPVAHIAVHLLHRTHALGVAADVQFLVGSGHHHGARQVWSHLPEVVPTAAIEPTGAQQFSPSGVGRGHDAAPTWLAQRRKVSRIECPRTESGSRMLPSAHSFQLLTKQIFGWPEERTSRT